MLDQLGRPWAVLCTRHESVTCSHQSDITMTQAINCPLMRGLATTQAAHLQHPRYIHQDCLQAHHCSSLFNPSTKLRQVPISCYSICTCAAGSAGMMRTNSPTRTTGGNTTASAKFVTTRPAHVAPAPAGVVPTSPRGLLVQAKATPPEGAAAPYAVQQAGGLHGIVV